MRVDDITTQLPFVGDVFGTFGPKTSLTFHWNGGLAGSDPFSQLVADANLHISKGWGGVSYHKAIGMDGTVYQLRNPDAILAAVANADGNETSEMVQLMIGRNDSGIVQHPSPEMWASAAALAREAQAQDKRIYGHRDWSQTECPGSELYAWIQRQGWQEEDMTRDELLAILNDPAFVEKIDTFTAIKQVLADEAAAIRNVSASGSHVSDTELADIITKIGVGLQKIGERVIDAPQP